MSCLISKTTGNSPTTDQRGEFCNFDISEWKLWLLWRSPAQWYGRAAPYNSFFDVRHPLISGFHPSAIEIVFYSIYFNKFTSVFFHIYRFTLVGKICFSAILVGSPIGRLAGYQVMESQWKSVVATFKVFHHLWLINKTSPNKCKPKYFADIGILSSGDINMRQVCWGQESEGRRKTWDPSHTDGGLSLYIENPS